MLLKTKFLTFLLGITFCSSFGAAGVINSTHQIHKIFTISTSDGVSLFGQLWEPVDSIAGVICLIHGHGEHTGRYATFASAMNDAGFAVMGFDLRGNGKSGGQRGHVSNYEQVMDDCSLILLKLCGIIPKRWCFFTATAWAAIS